jgi:uncharacterized protein (DUF2062 family)
VSKGGVGAWVRRRVLDPILALLRQGVTPEKLALSLAFGVGLGVLPVLGLSTVGCTVAAIGLRLNLPAIQLVSYLCSPLQLALIIPFVRVGEHLVGAAPQPLTISAGFKLIESGVITAIITLWDAIVHAMIGWIVIGPFAIYGLYRLAKPPLERAALKFAAARVAAETAP